MENKKIKHVKIDYFNGFMHEGRIVPVCLNTTLTIKGTKKAPITKECILNQIRSCSENMMITVTYLTSRGKEVAIESFVHDKKTDIVHPVYDVGTSPIPMPIL
jgi:hypothetical protein